MIPGTWQPGDEPGRRRFARLFEEHGLPLECGERLPGVTVAYETWGTLDHRRANAVLVLHALTGDSHAAGPAEPGHLNPGWWDGLIGPGLAIDTNRFFVVCPNVLGGCQGTTGPSSPAPDGAPYGSRFPRVTVRDQVAVEAALAVELGIERWACVIGGSMGGMRALEWAVTHPSAVGAAVLLAVGAAATADQIALCSVQARAIRADPAFCGGDYYGTGKRPVEGMAIARAIGQVSYRTEAEFQARFANRPQDESPLSGGRYQIESYLEHHGRKLASRFDPNSYLVLSEAMNHHDVGRGRGGIAPALRRVSAKVAIVGISSDRLYPVHLQRQLVDALEVNPLFEVVGSEFGHDGFLLEIDALSPTIRKTLEEC